MTLSTVLGVAALLSVPGTALAQASLPVLEGTWRTETPDGPHEIVVRADSSASWGDETVRWRLIADSIFLAFGDEWMVYNYRLDRNALTLSGGDLVDPIELERVGPATPRPSGVPVPPAPPMSRRADVFDQ